MKTLRTVLLILVLLVTLLLTSNAVGATTIPKILTNSGSQKPGGEQAATFFTSTPEKQGMDSSALLQLLDQIEADQMNIHSFLVMRHGAIVLEAYYPPFDRKDKHMLFSSTKSVLSALVGIAVAEGKIENLDDPVLNYFPDYIIANGSEWKEKITIHHLLDMTSGLDSSDEQLVAPPGHQFCLDLPVLIEPGAVFEYMPCNSILLSAILQKTTGMTTLAYAQEKLFGPLEIQDVYWSTSPDGVTRGNTGLMLTPRDMLKFGQLYMQNGVWQGKQVVPAEWVQETEWGNESDPNAFYHNQWWRLGGAIGAYGYAGQIIFVFPLSDLVVVVTAQFPQDEIYTYAGNLAWSAFDAIRSDEALPASPASRVLAECIKAIAHPQAQDVPALPTMAKWVSGKTFNLDENPLGWQTAKLEFEGKEAWLTITTNGAIDQQKFAIGLNGLFRRSEQQAVNSSDLPLLPQHVDTNPFEFNFVVGVPIKGTVWMRGGWTSDDTFSLTVQDSRDFDREILNFRFQPPAVQIDWFSVDVNATLLTFAGAWY